MAREGDGSRMRGRGLGEFGEICELHRFGNLMGKGKCMI